jgi:hypothetical protein
MTAEVSCMDAARPRSAPGDTRYDGLNLGI